MFTTALTSVFLLSLGLEASAQSTSARTAYTPSRGACPADFQLVRSAGASNQTLGQDESNYVSTRKSQVQPSSWSTYLQNVQAKNFTLPDYVTSTLGNGSNNGMGLPNLGIATSGGGYRAAMFGAAVLNSLDGRNATSKDIGTGGLLQAATYLSGLSGGSWLVTSFAQANCPTFQDLVFGPSGSNNSTTDFGGWNAQFDLFLPSSNTTENLLFITEAISETGGKHAAGFPITIADPWARLLARHFANGTNPTNFFDTSVHGAGITFSGIANQSCFANHQLPLPIIVSDTRNPNDNESDVVTAEGDVVPLNNVIYEFTFFEMGSYDPPLASFTPTRFLGTTNTSSCVTNFDQATFICGASSELFNEFNITLQSFLTSSVGPVISILNSSLPEDDSVVELDVTMVPNPFFGVANGTFPQSNQAFLRLVDGGEDGQVIPLQPLLVKAREVDVILAIDGTNDISGYAAGSSVIATQNRTSFFPSAYSFPQVPTDINTFVGQNLTHHPTFFGCNESAPVPLLIYIANGAAPPGLPPITNVSTDQSSFTLPNAQAFLDEAYVIATQGFPNGSQTSDSEWPACLACAVVDRVRAKQNITRSGICSDCFNRYCWNATQSTLSTNNGGSGSSSSSSVTLHGNLKSTYAYGIIGAMVILSMAIL
ncbi:hypothetical protein SCHPADRAFT_819487 [Schizopora paradoxa]|uniref:Lysophospholipase n=1 Tax=Schizopora paradoxa TaxID=27342 RepID=A0A0H2SAF5_9AGAM|nr:hypothetical protein SCHPADRAFT_819487 [Schizopora paradoxa]